MKTFYVIDSSMYYVTKLMSLFVKNNHVNFSVLSLDTDCQNKEIIFIVNDVHDFIEFLVLKEHNQNVYLVITNALLIKKIALMKSLKGYTFSEFETYFRQELISIES
jgi:hypothetical protein